MRALALIVLTACGGGASRASAGADAPGCDAVAAHVLELAERDNSAPAGSELADGIRGEAARQCASTPWSAERRRCLAAAATQDATLACRER